MMLQGGCANSIRGVTGRRRTPSDPNQMDYITIQSTGNATDFGDLTSCRNFCRWCSPPTKSFFGGATPSLSKYN